MYRVLPTLQRLDLLPRTTANASLAVTPASSPRHEEDLWFVPTLANLTGIVPSILRESCPSIAANYNVDGHRQELPSMLIAEPHEGSDDPFGTYRAAKDVWKKGGAVARSLFHVLAFDYACFYGGTTGLPKIPAVCRDVYTSGLFLERILGPSS